MSILLTCLDLSRNEELISQYQIIHAELHYKQVSSYSSTGHYIEVLSVPWQIIFALVLIIIRANIHFLSMASFDRQIDIIMTQDVPTIQHFTQICTIFAILVS